MTAKKSRKGGRADAESGKGDKAERPAPENFTVERITAATMVTLACNTVAHVLDTEEGTPSRNATVRMCDKTFGDMRKSAEACRKAGDDFVADTLWKGIEAYEAYLNKHNVSESMKTDEPGRADAIKEAADAMEHLADVMDGLLRAF